MTDEDRQQEYAALLLELQNAEDELARIDENAKRLAMDIRRVADWIESASSPDFLQQMEIQQRHSKLSSENGSNRYSQALNFQRAAETVRLATKARKKVNNLQQRCTSLEIENPSLEPISTRATHHQGARLPRT